MENKEIISGRNPVLEYLKALKGGEAGRELFVSSSAHGKIITQIVDLARSKGVKVFMKEREFFRKHSSSRSNQGVILLVPLNKEREGLDDELLKVHAQGGIILVLDQITDPHNLGSIIRSAEALGCRTIVLPRKNSAEVNETARKSAAGATAHVNIHRVTNLARFLDRVRDMGFRVVGTSDHGKADLSGLREIRPACIVIGSEGKGMRRLTEERCDYVFAIPLKGKVSSLNASVAAGIILYEATKEM